MPFPRSSVDWLFVPGDVERDIDAEGFERLCSRWRERGFLEGQRCGPRRDGLIKGGFARVWLDRGEGIRLFANHQGGYRVRCPDTGGNLGRPFSEAVSRWRAGGPREVPCPYCGKPHPLESVSLLPAGAFGRAAVVFSAVGSLELGTETAKELSGLLGEHREVVKRMG